MLLEAKSTLTFAELIAGTREVSLRIARGQKLPVTRVSEERSDYMKMVMFSGQCSGENPIITFYDTERKSESPPTMGLVALLALANGDTSTARISPDQPVKVSCTCGLYKSYFAQANFDADAHHGVRPRKVEPADYGYKKVVNSEHLPGVCVHLMSLFDYLQNINKVKR